MKDKPMSEDLRLSVSKTKTFNSCKKQFQFSYILKFPRKDFAHYTFGHFCHKVLEEFHLTYINGSQEPYNDIMAKSFKIAWVEYKDKMTSEMKREAWDICNQYLRKITQNKKDKKLSLVLAAEKPFELKIAEDIIVVGVIDKVQQDADNVLHVCDYKTTKEKKYLLKDDFFQLLTYAYVLYQANQSIEKVRCSYVMLRHNFEHITIEFSIDEILTVENAYKKYADQIRSEEKYDPNPTFLCKWCEFLEFCDEGKKQVNPPLEYGAVEW